MKINETSLSRVWQHTQSDRPFAILTAFRGEHDYETNVRRNKELAATIRKLGYGFFYVDGFWVENQGTPEEVHVSEDSIFVVGKVGGEQKFKEEMLLLGSKYDQEGVLLKLEDGAKIFNSLGDVTYDIGTLKPGKAGEMYTKLRPNKKANTFIFESERDDLGWLQRMAGMKR